MTRAKADKQFEIFMHECFKERQQIIEECKKNGEWTGGLGRDNDKLLAVNEKIKAKIIELKSLVTE